MQLGFLSKFRMPKGATGYDPAQVAEQWRRRIDREEQSMVLNVAALDPLVAAGSGLNLTKSKKPILNSSQEGSRAGSRLGTPDERLGTAYTASSVAGSSRPGTGQSAGENGGVPRSTSRRGTQDQSSGEERARSKTGTPGQLQSLQAELALERAKRTEAEAEVKKLRSIIEASEE